MAADVVVVNRETISRPGSSVQRLTRSSGTGRRVVPDVRTRQVMLLINMSMKVTSSLLCATVNRDTDRSSLALCHLSIRHTSKSQWCHPQHPKRRNNM
jgi:hypothetical protein